MLHRNNKLGLATTLAALAAMTVGASAAQASFGPVPDGTYACVFDGLNGHLTGPIGTVGGEGTYTFSSKTAPGLLPSIADCAFVEADTAVTPVSSLVDSKDVPDGLTGVYPVDIESTGNYENLVCGTGNAIGTAGIAATGGPLVTGVSVPPVLPSGANVGGPSELGTNAGGTLVNANLNPGHVYATDADYSGASYNISFVAGQGVLQIRTVSGPDGDTGTGDGYVSIAPVPSQGSTNTVDINNFCGQPTTVGPVTVEPVTDFTVAGAFAADVFDPAAS